MSVNSETDQLLDHLSMNGVGARRLYLAHIFHARFKGTVQYGPLKGLQLLKDSSWGAADIAPKLFGFYEQEVVAKLAASPATFDTLINIGAGDGIYGVGLLVAGIAQRSICFEASEKGRSILHRTAGLNGVAERTLMLEAAGPDFCSHPAIQQSAATRRLFVIDIEGGEFELLTAQALDQMRDAHLMIELHGGMVRQGHEHEKALLARLQDRFDIELIVSGARDPSRIPEIRSLGDSDRWLLCSEGRPYLMRWIYCRPRQ